MSSKENKKNIIMGFIREYSDENRVPPTVREIEKGTGIPRSTVSRYVSELKAEGLLNSDGHRSVRRSDTDDTVSIPILGTISCGPMKSPDLYTPDTEFMSLPLRLFGGSRNSRYYLLLADGDSMTDAGIQCGDYVLIRHTDHAEKGNIVVALTGDESTLKRYFPEPENRRIRLHPENPKLDDIYVDSCIIQGVAVYVIHKIQY